LNKVLWKNHISRVRSWEKQGAKLTVSLTYIGLFGTLSYSVTLRRREVGLRLALGALRGQIVKHFLLQGLAVTFLGCVAGWAFAEFARQLEYVGGVARCTRRAHTPRYSPL